MTKLEMFMYYIGAGMGGGYDIVEIESEQPLIIVMRNRKSGELISFNYSEEFALMNHEESK
jgi:hypothetical protein